MRLAVIGTGKMGSALCAQLAAAGHEVRLGSRDAERGRERAREAGASFGGTYEQAAKRAEVIVLAVPWDAVWETLIAVGDLRGKVLVDVTNPTLGRPDRPELHGSSGAEELQAVVPHAHVVKAWNTLYSEVIRSSADFGGTAATVFVAGDDDAAKETVARLVADLGYMPADAGPLSSARYLEPLASLMTALDRMARGRTQHAVKLLRREAAPRPAQTASGTSSKASTSTKPRSVILSAGTTDSARNASI